MELEVYPLDGKEECESVDSEGSQEDGGEGNEGQWEDWTADESQEEFICLFCPDRFGSTSQLFDHCSEQHAFDFSRIKDDLNLDFYGSIRFINFVRAQVACNTCWACGLIIESHALLLQHFHSTKHGDIKSQEDKSHLIINYDSCSHPGPPWQDEKYLKPFFENDALLYSFEESFEDDTSLERVNTQIIKDCLGDTELESLLLAACEVNDEDATSSATAGFKTLPLYGHPVSDQYGSKEQDNGHPHQVDSKEKSVETGADDIPAHNVCAVLKKHRNKLKVSFTEVAARERYSINQSYFGSYSTFGIHREMLSDKVRTDAYESAITRNPSLLKGAVVMDLGCGTGILSLFAAKAGAQKVIAVDGSKRMCVVAQQVAQANGFSNGIHSDRDERTGPVIDVVHGMIEEVNLEKIIDGKSVDVLVSEWMGYCLLYESMLSSVLFARDRWLKPGGAILPDIAEMYLAGFGVGGTSLPFWENVYGFDMKCIGKEVLEDATSSLIVDVVESKDIVTNPCLFKRFDLVTMHDSDIDFTASFELNPLASPQKESESGSVWCYGVVVWFDTQFSGRFAKENPVLLSTSPYTPKTHWSQTLLTFQEPVCLSCSTDPYQKDIGSGKVGSAASPAAAIKGRISIARSSRHRSIDISLEMTAVGPSGIAQDWPVQLFDM
ncbi:hypothetical protein KP509_05G067400 [Ceratopteris richardii]|uniref:C2H2-type domain-containing protein n=1 Tax=Ceratopteris richardii TaxID=49495 RepID=A0A8T2UTX9_CERRI|nr:hypothetical protein KP509_05G067400 [Ceratopteris richardii]